MSLLADHNDRLFQGEAPVPLRDLAGVWASETDVTAPGKSVPLQLPDGSQIEGAAGEIVLDVLIPDEGTRILAQYGLSFMQALPP